MYGDNEHVILDSGFSYPGWDWKNKQTKPKFNHPALHNSFASPLDNTGLMQMVEEPMREENILDLICTNLPSKINNNMNKAVILWWDARNAPQSQWHYKCQGA